MSDPVGVGQAPLEGLMKNIPARDVARAVWHQSRPSNTLLQFEDPATYDGSYNRAGEPAVWYASFTERGTRAELFRHWGQDEIFPFEVRRRVGVDALAVLDLTDPDVRDVLGVTEDELVADDVTRCQQLAADARDAGFDGLLAPSGALDGETTWRCSPRRWARSRPSIRGYSDLRCE